MSIDLGKMPKLGFGMMRLPEKDGTIDIDHVCRIPDVFRAVNTMTLYKEEFRPKAFYGGLIGQGYGRASDCIACGQCEGVCPQHLHIIDLLKDAAVKLDA